MYCGFMILAQMPKEADGCVGAARLIAAHSALPEDVQKEASRASTNLRLQVSGSAPLPESVKRRWEEEGGVGGGMKLLERCGRCGYLVRPRIDVLPGMA